MINNSQQYQDSQYYTSHPKLKEVHGKYLIKINRYESLEYYANHCIKLLSEDTPSEIHITSSLNRIHSMLKISEFVNDYFDGNLFKFNYITFKVCMKCLNEDLSKGGQGYTVQELLSQVKETGSLYTHFCSDPSSLPLITVYNQRLSFENDLWDKEDPGYQKSEYAQRNCSEKMLLKMYDMEDCTKNQDQENEDSRSFPNQDTRYNDSLNSTKWQDQSYRQRPRQNLNSSYHQANTMRDNQQILNQSQYSNSQQHHAHNDFACPHHFHTYEQHQHTDINFGNNAHHFYDERPQKVNPITHYTRNYSEIDYESQYLHRPQYNQTSTTQGNSPNKKRSNQRSFNDNRYYNQQQYTKSQPHQNDQNSYELNTSFDYSSQFGKPQSPPGMLQLIDSGFQIIKKKNFQNPQSHQRPHYANHQRQNYYSNQNYQRKSNNDYVNKGYEYHNNQKTQIGERSNNNSGKKVFRMMNQSFS